MSSASPTAVAADDLAIDITSIGVITSVFPLCYGCSKFVSGVIGDVLSPRAMLSSGVALNDPLARRFDAGVRA